MAKPLESSDSTSHHPDRDISFFGSSPRHSGARKRTRNSDLTTCEEALIPCEHPEDGHKTRRVNPQRLAARLAPDLVAEMEAYIVPGAKMPNFSVRKDFQERYCVDRRHIYDYFHSRGLRVAKEDKHTNLTRGRMLPTMSRRPPQESMPETVAPMESCEDNIPRVQMDCSFPALPKILPKKRVSHLASAKIPVVKSRRRLGLSKAPATGLSPSLSSPEISHSLADDEDSSYDAPGSPCPEFTFPEEFPDTPLLVEDSEISVYDSTSELHCLYGIANDFSIDSSPQNCLFGHANSPVSIEDYRPLTQDERNEFYNLINGSLPQSSGIAERSGTYSAYMEEQSRRYFVRLANNATPVYTRINNLRSATETPGEEVDFQKWLAVPARRDSIKATYSYAEAPAPHLADIHNHRTWLPTDPEVGGDVDLLVRRYLDSGVADTHGVPERTSNKHGLSSTPKSGFGSRSFQGQSIEEELSRTVDNVASWNVNARTVENRGLYDRFTSARVISYAIPGRSRTNSAGGGI